MNRQDLEAAPARHRDPRLGVTVELHAMSVKFGPLVLTAECGLTWITPSPPIEPPIIVTPPYPWSSMIWPPEGPCNGSRGFSLRPLTVRVPRCSQRQSRRTAAPA